MEFIIDILLKFLTLYCKYDIYEVLKDYGDRKNRAECFRIDKVLICVYKSGQDENDSGTVKQGIGRGVAGGIEGWCTGWV